MLDYTNIKQVVTQANQYVLRLFDLIEEKGGIVDRKLYMDPETAHKTTFGISSPWIARFMGNDYDTVDKMMTKAMKVAFDNDRSKDITPSMRGLANNLLRQSTSISHVVRHNLNENLSLISRFRATLQWTLLFDEPVYNIDNTDRLVLAHYISYLYKYSPLSGYIPEIWLMNAQAYSEVRTIDLTDQELNTLAECAVALQEAFGIKDHAHEYKPNSLQDTQIRALSSNPKAAYSMPTMTNAKDKKARKLQLELAQEYLDDPSKHGNLPYVGQRRIQQGGNVLLVYLKELYPDIDWDITYPTEAQFDACLSRINDTRPRVEYYTKDETLPEKYVTSVRLPGSLEERTKLVENGSESEVILQQHKTDMSFKFNFRDRKSVV